MVVTTGYLREIAQSFTSAPSYQTAPDPDSWQKSESFLVEIRSSIMAIHLWWTWTVFDTRLISASSLNNKLTRGRLEIKSWDSQFQIPVRFFIPDCAHQFLRLLPGIVVRARRVLCNYSKPPKFLLRMNLTWGTYQRIWRDFFPLSMAALCLWLERRLDTLPHGEYAWGSLHLESNENPTHESDGKLRSEFQTL